MKVLLPSWLGALALAACAPATVVPADLPRATPAGIARASALPAPYNRGDPVAGREAFALCAECHALNRTGSQEKGPVLAGFFGKPAAGRGDYAYSEAMMESGAVSDSRHLDQWLFNPRETMPGTTMKFIGIRNDSKRYDLMAYLAAVTE